MNAEEFVSGYVKGSDLPPGFRKRMRVAAVSSAEFDDGRKLVIFLDEFYGRGVPLNQTRLRAMIEGCGHDTEHWVGREVDIFHATAFSPGQAGCGGRHRSLGTPGRRSAHVAAARRQGHVHERRSDGRANA